LKTGEKLSLAAIAVSAIAGVGWLMATGKKDSRFAIVPETHGIEIQRGSNGSINAQVTQVSGVPSPVVIMPSTDPSGIKFDAVPNSGTPTFNTLLKFQVPSTVPKGTYNIFISATSEVSSFRLRITVYVTSTSPVENKFDIVVANPTIAIAQGSSGTVAVGIRYLEGDATAVSLNMSTPAQGIAGTFNPPHGTPSFNSILTIQVSTITPLGDHEVHILGSNGDMMLDEPILLTVIPASNPQTGIIYVQAYGEGPYGYREEVAAYVKVTPGDLLGVTPAIFQDLPPSEYLVEAEYGQIKDSRVVSLEIGETENVVFDWYNP